MDKTVLVVDDDEFFRKTVSDGLRAAGYEVAVAADGLEAIEKVRAAPPNFILLDLIMPKMDGVRTLKALKRHPEYHTIPVIILTGVGPSGLKVLEHLEAEAAVAKRQAESTCAEVLRTLWRLESAPARPRPPAHAVAGFRERRIVSELLAERQHTRTLLDALGEGVVELDECGRAVYANPAALSILDVAEDEILGVPGAGLLGAPNVSALQDGLREVQTDGGERTARLEVLCGHRTIGVSVTALPRAEGLAGAMLVLRDLTDLTRRAQSLRALAAVGQRILARLDLPALLREIVARTAEVLGAERCALFRIEPAGDQLWLRCIEARGLSERYFQRIYLSPGEAVQGRAAVERRPVHTSDLLSDPSIFLSDAARARAREEGIGAVLATPILLGEEVFGTLTVYRPAGHRFTSEEVDLATSLAGFAASAIENARLHAELRTYSQELEEKVEERTRELRALNRELEVASRHKTEFLANMSHELRTPLHGVLGFADLLLGAAGVAPGALNGQQQRYLEAIRASGGRLLELINDLLDLAKIEAGRMTLDLREVAVRPALQEAVNPARFQALQKGLTLDLQVGEVPETVRMDPRKFQQILGNLLANAIKFTPAGGTITVQAQGVPDPRGAALELAVRDTGIGIAPADQARLFQEFVQLDGSLAKRHPGTGLGLALARRLVRLHHGRIWAASKGPGKGATFAFRLPCRPEALTGKVLVVEDDGEAREYVRDVLEGHGVEVQEAVEGLQALRMIEEAPPDILVLDLQLPLMHGYEVIRRLRQAPRTARLPILVVTGLGRRDGHVAVEQGADEYLTKPFKPDALIEAVDRLLERRAPEAVVAS